MGLITFTNTEYLSEAANDFKRNKGVYTRAPFGSKEYKDYWDIQKKRCLNGFTVGDLSITGRHYFYLNFCPIKRTDSSGKEIIGMQAKELLFPKFWEIDYHWWWAKDISMKGMKKERMELLSIDGLPIKDYVDGKHLSCLKTRRAGFSYKEAADGVYNFNFIPKSKSYYFAAKKPFLDEDGILNKVSDYLTHLNTNTQRFWRKNRMVKDTMFHRKASYLDKRKDEKGYMSEIMGVIIDNPHKVRGKDGIKITYEEAGSFKNLKAALAISMPSVKDGGVMTGQISVFGCVCAGTEVYKANGEKIRVENLKQEDGILGYNGTTVSQEPIIWMQPIARKECVEITLETGITLRCSVDHPILSSNTALKARTLKKSLVRKRVQFKQAVDLNTQDVVAVIEELPIFGDQDNPYAYTTGLLIGDGYYGGTIEVIIDNQECLDQIELELGRDDIVHKRSYQTTGVVSYSLKGPIRQYLMANGMHGQSKQAKRFPESWRTFNKRSLALMLAGYFDADGNTKKCKKRGVSVIYTSVVKELLEETQEALLRFGIHGNLMQEFSKGGYSEGHTVYRLYITRAESVDNFRKFIPIINPTKAIPRQSKRINKLLRDAEFIKTEQYAHNPHLKPLTGAVLYRVVSVVSIGEQDIYNLNAGNSHTYLANNIITHNTGGEEGPDIEGLEEIFGDPDAYDMLAWNNIWEEGMEATACGYFVPCYMANQSYMDESGNVDIPGAIAYDEKEREKKKKLKDPKELDRRIAEFPRNPSEALQRVSTNIFPVEEIKQQLKRVENNEEILSSVLHGVIFQGQKRVEFSPSSNVHPILQFPHKNDDDLTGCVTIYDKPECDTRGIAIPGAYFTVVDPYYKDQAEDRTSLWAAYVFKQKRRGDPSSNKMVASYIARPTALRTAYRNTVLLTQMYNGTIQSEIAGGGQGLFDYLREKKLLHLAEYQPELFTTTEKGVNVKNRSYFMNISTEEKKNGASYLADWMLEQIGINAEGQPILRLHLIKDVAFLKELMRYNPEKGNFDRISAFIVAMYMLKEKELFGLEQERSRSGFFNRAGFGEGSVSSSLGGYLDVA